MKPKPQRKSLTDWDTDDMLPLNEVNIRYKDEQTKTSYWYGLNIHLKQADMPYDPATGATENVHIEICADTIFIEESLLNPGYDIRLTAREIRCAKGIQIVTTPFAPAENYTSLNPARQTENASGSNGANGRDGGRGSDAGAIRIVAEKLLINGVNASNKFQLDEIAVSAMLGREMEASFKRFKPASSAFRAYEEKKLPVFVGNQPTPMQVKADKFGFTIDHVKSQSTWDPARKELCVRFYAKAFVTAEVEAFVLLPPSGLKGICNCEVDLFVEQQYKGDLQAGTPAATGKPVISFGSASDSFFKFKTPMPLLAAVLGPMLQTELPQPLLAHLQTELVKLVPPYFKLVNPLSDLKPDLLLITKGGQGGRGENGHDGIAGARGESGEQEVRADQKQRANGKKGGAGGSGGKAGKSGTGGNAGSISIHVISSNANCVYDIDGGDGGMAASGGRGAIGGQGGIAGTWEKLETIPGRPTIKRTLVPGDQGSRGERGKDATDQSNAAAGGRSQFQYMGASWYDRIAPFFHPEQLLITQRAATFLYLNAENEAARKSAMVLTLWLTRITETLAHQNKPKGIWTVDYLLIAKNILDFAHAMTGNFERGLDYYGHYRNWVPALSIDSYQLRITQLLLLGKIVEDQLNRFSDQDEKATERMKFLNTVKGKVHDDLVNETDEVAFIDERIQKLDKHIDELTGIMHSQISHVLEAQDLFTKEFRDYNKRETACEFQGMIHVITALVQLGTVAYGNVNGIANSYNELKGMTEAVETVKHSIKILKQAKATVESLKDALNEVSDAMMNDGKNVGLVVTNKEEFDQMIAEYLGKFKAADELKRAVYDLLNTIDTRNQGICAYNSYFILKEKKRAEIEQTKNQLNQVTTWLKEGKNDPALPGYIAFMQAACNNVKTLLVRKLYEQARAFEHWSLKEVQLKVNDLNMGTLTTTHTNLTQKIDEYREQQGVPFQSFTKVVSINTASNGFAFHLLRDTRRLVFEIPIDSPDFDDQYMVKVSHVQIAFPGIVSKTLKFSLNLTHSGNSIICEAPRKPNRQFVHMPRTINYKIDYKDSRNSGGGTIGDDEAGNGKQGFTGLSPFTKWTLDFGNLNSEQQEAIKNLAEVELTFKGTYTSGKLTKAAKEKVAKKSTAAKRKK